MTALTHIRTALILGTTLMISACSIAQPLANLLSEAREIRAKNPDANRLNLDQIARKYIPAGTPMKVAVKYLTDLGFDVGPVLHIADAYTGQKRERSPPRWSAYSHDEYRVNLYVSNDKVERVTARLFIHSL